MERSGFAYQTLGEPERSLVEERRGDVVEEDMSDMLMEQGQHIPVLLIRLDTSKTRDSPVSHPIGPPFYYNNPLPWISLL